MRRCQYIGLKSEKMQKPSVFWLIATACLILLGGCDDSDRDIGPNTAPNTGPPMEMTNGYVRLPPPGMNMTAAFGALTNLSGSAMTIVAVSSPQFSDVSLHRTVLENGVAKMRETSSLTIETGQQLIMKPGGYHLMLMGSKADLGKNDQVVVVWNFDNGAVVKTKLPMRSAR